MLLFGARRGACSVAVGVSHGVATPQKEEQPKRGVTIPPTPVKDTPKPTSAEQIDEEKKEEQTEQTENAEKVENPEDSGIFETGVQEKRLSIWERIQRTATEWGNSFVGKDQDDF